MTDRTVSVKLTADIATFERRIKQAATTAQTAGRQIMTTAEQQADAFNTVGVAAGVAGAAGALALQQMASEAIAFESAFAGVRKTVKGSAAELDVLGASLRSMALRDVPVSVNALSDIAASAGQLGIQTGRIEDFTQVIADLGVATDLTGTQAATGMARFANITQMPQEQFDRLGSTVVALGNNLATTESEIVEMGLRLAGAGAQIGMTEAQILAMAGALSSVGIEAEAGGTAFSRVMVDIAQAVETSSDKLDGFAEVAGMSAEAFAVAFRNDPAAAITSFVAGLGAISDAGGNTFGVLEDLELGEIRVRDALLRTSGAGQLLVDSLDLSAAAWEDNNALTEEAAQRYETTESQIQFAKNALVDLGIELGENLLPLVQAAGTGVSELAGFVSGLPEPVQTTAVGFLALASALGVVGGAVLLALPRIAATRVALADLGITAASTRSALLSVGAVKFTAATVLLGVLASRLMDARAAAEGFVTELQSGLDNPADQIAALNEELERQQRLAGEGLSIGGLLYFSTDAKIAADRVDEINRSLGEHREALEAAAYEGQRFGSHQQALNHYLDLGYSYTDAFAAASMEMAQNADAAATATDGWTQRTIDHQAATEAGITATDGWTNSVLDAEVAARRLGGGVEALGDSQRDQLRSFSGYADNFGTYARMLDELNAANRAHAEETASATASAEDSWEDYFTEVPASAELYLQSLADQAAAQQEWASLVADAQARGLDDLAAQIVAAGPEQNALYRELLVDGPLEQAEEAERLLEQQALNNLAGMVAVVDRDGFQFVDAMGRVSGDAVDAMAEELGWSKEAVAAALDASEAVVAEREARIVAMFGDTGRNAVAALNEMLAAGVVDAGELAWAYQEALRTGVNPLVVALGGESIPQQARILGVPVGVMRNEGGPIPGRGPDVDSVHAMLTPGEYVLRRAAVDRIGTSRLDLLNAGRGTVVPDVSARFNTGGHVDPREGAAVAGPAHTGFSTARDVPTPPSHPYSGAVGAPLDASTAMLYQAVVDYVEQFGAGRPELGTQPFAKGGGGGPAGRYTAGMMRAYEQAVSLGFSSIGGYRASGSVKGSDHPRHRAWDFMLPGGVGAEAPGWQLANWHIANSTDIGTKYLIFSDMINSGSGWRGYRHPSDPSGRNATLAHRDHLHASYLANGGLIPSQPGGARPIIGEGTHNEVVLPLGGQVLSDVGLAIATAIMGAAGAVGNIGRQPWEAGGNIGRQPGPWEAGGNIGRQPWEAAGNFGRNPNGSHPAALAAGFVQGIRDQVLIDSAAVSDLVSAGAGGVGGIEETLKAITDLQAAWEAEAAAQGLAAERAQLWAQVGVADAAIAEAEAAVAAADSTDERTAAEQDLADAQADRHQGLLAIQAFDVAAAHQAEADAIAETVEQLQAQLELERQAAELAAEIAGNREMLRIEALEPGERLLEIEREMAALAAEGLAYSDEWVSLLREAEGLQQDIARDAAATADEAQRLADAARDAAEARAQEADRLATALGGELDQLLDRKAALDKQAADAMAANARAVADAQRAAANEIAGILQGRTDALTAAFGGPTNPFQTTWGNTAGALTDNVRDQVAMFDEWADGVSELRDRGVSESMIEALGLDDPAQLGQVRLLLAATTDELAQLDAALAMQRDRAAEQAEHESTILLGAVGRAVSQVRDELAVTLEDLRVQLNDQLAVIADETAMLGLDTGRGYAEAMAEALASGLPGIIAIAEEYEDALGAARDAAEELRRMNLQSTPGIHISDTPGGGPPIIGPGGNWGDVLAGGVHTYDTGGRWPAGTLGYNAGAAGDEWVLTDPQLRAMVQATPSSAMPSSMRVRIGEREFTAYVEDINDGYHRTNAVHRSMSGSMAGAR